MSTPSPCLFSQSLVLAKHVTNLAPADSDVASWNVGTRVEVPKELDHGGFTKPTHLCSRFPLRTNVRSTLATSRWKPGENIFEDETKAQKLVETALVYSEMEP